MIFPRNFLSHWAAAATPTQTVNRGFALLMVLLVLLGAFLLTILLINFARRHRRNADDAKRLAERAEASNDVDPWYEAGRRARAEDSQNDTQT